MLNVESKIEYSKLVSAIFKEFSMLMALFYITCLFGNNDFFKFILFGCRWNVTGYFTHAFLLMFKREIF